MIVNILGVGKSGTSILYVLLQKMMEEQLAGQVSSYYEPLLRDTEFIGQRYSEFKGKHAFNASISHEGIACHLRLPMLVSDSTPYLDDPYLNTIYPRMRKKSWNRWFGQRKNQDKHILAKYIRACGRYPLLSKLCPSAKTVFIVRNPASVLNSVRNRFSFYGGEFHRDDRPRFLDQVNRHFSLDIHTEDFKNEAHSQLHYWYYTNKYALETFSASGQEVHILCYEDFFAKPANRLPALCEFLGLEYRDSYLDLLQKPVGGVTNSFRFHEDESALAAKYLDKYESLLADAEISAELNNIRAKLESCDSDTLLTRSRYYGLHARAVEKLATAGQAALFTAPVDKGRPLITHIINPVNAPPSSDLHMAQPVTFETMMRSKRLADSEGIGVELRTACFAEDSTIVPPEFVQQAPLTRSCLDFASFDADRKLPLFKDILSAARKGCNSDYIIYTNTDIALMPHFYLTAQSLIAQGYEVINIFRRTLAKEPSSVESIPIMYADLGEDHPGTDCFIVKRDILEKVDLGNIVIGARFCAFALRANLFALSRSIIEYPKLHMTFHLGDDRVWEEQDEYGAYNAEEVKKMFLRLEQKKDIYDPEIVARFKGQFENRVEKWTSSRGKI